jgi:dihydroflavonol-4-reductase
MPSKDGAPARPRGRVAVTGATGHLGSVLVRKLLGNGYGVRAVVRDPQRLAETPWIQWPGLEVMPAEMTDQSAMHMALEGVDGVFHVAAAFDVASLPAGKLISVNVGGVEAVMRAAAAQQVRRVVLTSSAAAVGTSPRDGPMRSEEDWNDETPEAYARSKVRAERRAWTLAQEFGLSLISILPGAMLGPGFNRTTPTLGLVRTGLDNGFPLAPPIDFAFTDVRDVADAHLSLYEAPRAKGRYLVSGPTRSVHELLALIRHERAAVRVPPEMPLWFARIFPLIDATRHLLTQRPRQMRRGFVAEYAGRHHALRTEKAEREIGWRPRPLAESLRDTIAWLEGARPGGLLDI